MSKLRFMKKVSFTILGFMSMCAALLHSLKKDVGLRNLKKTTLNEIILAENETTSTGGGGSSSSTCLKFCPPIHGERG